MPSCCQLPVPTAPKAGRAAIVLPSPQRACEWLLTATAFVFGEIRTKEPGAQEAWEQKPAQVEGLWAAKFVPPSPFRSWSCDLLFSWMRGSLFLLFFCLLRK